MCPFRLRLHSGCLCVLCGCVRLFCGCLCLLCPGVAVGDRLVRYGGKFLPLFQHLCGRFVSLFCRSVGSCCRIVCRLLEQLYLCGGEVLKGERIALVAFELCELFGREVLISERKPTRIGRQSVALNHPVGVRGKVPQFHVDFFGVIDILHTVRHKVVNQA